MQRLSLYGGRRGLQVRFLFEIVVVFLDFLLQRRIFSWKFPDELLIIIFVLEHAFKHLGVLVGVVNVLVQPVYIEILSILNKISKFGFYEFLDLPNFIGFLVIDTFRDDFYVP